VLFKHYTDEAFQERNHLNVLFVVNDLQDQVISLCSVEFTVQRSHTYVHWTSYLLKWHGRWTILMTVF